VFKLVLNSIFAFFIHIELRYRSFQHLPYGLTFEIELEKVATIAIYCHLRRPDAIAFAT